MSEINAEYLKQFDDYQVGQMLATSLRTVENMERFSLEAYILKSSKRSDVNQLTAQECLYGKT